MHLGLRFRFRCLAMLMIAIITSLVWRYGILPNQLELAAQDYVISRGGGCGTTSIPRPLWMAWFNPFPPTTSITSVSLHHDQIDERVIRHLRDFRDVEWMKLCGPRVTDQAIEQIAHLPIQVLHLNASQVTDKGIAILARMATLRELQLNGTRITDDGIAELMKHPDLERLTVADTNISDVGVMHLRNAQQLRRLRVSDFVSEQTMKELSQLLPGCEISR